MKPFKGVITAWELTADNRIHGLCLHHTTYENGIAQNEPIATSTVISIKPVADYSQAKECETRNSIYILV